MDPGLETNNGNNYFISGGVFEANTFTNSQEYGTFPVTYGGESFVLTFDIEILSRTSGDGDIGLFSSSRKGSQGPGAPDSTIFVIYGGFEKGLGLRGVSPSGVGKSARLRWRCAILRVASRRNSTFVPWSDQ